MSERNTVGRVIGVLVYGVMNPFGAEKLKWLLCALLFVSVVLLHRLPVHFHRSKVVVTNLSSALSVWSFIYELILYFTYSPVCFMFPVVHLSGILAICLH